MEFYAFAIITLCLVAFLYSLYIVKLKNTSRTLSQEIQEKERDLEKKTEELKAKDLKNKQFIAHINKKKRELKHLLELEGNEDKLKKSIIKLKEAIIFGEKKHRDITKENEELADELESVKRDLSIFMPQMDLVNLGFFEEPDHLFDTSERFKEEIKTIRDQQKEMIKNSLAIILPDSIAITDNNQLAQKAMTGQSDLMLRSFNIDCDKLISSIKPSNFPQILERIDKVATSIEKSSLSFACGFNPDYIDLKFKECEISYQYSLKKKREKEEQDRIKEQIREEEKARQEYEKAIAKAEREEQIYEVALEEARKQLEVSGEKERDALAKKIESLQFQLQEAKEKNERAKSMAEQTKKGHVYVISNIGSFGENVYKIGLTRRLDPLDRVKELGDASVPFVFDVHAMIYSEDAPALERDLHKIFSFKRVNQVNMRKEFFEVTLEEIQEGVSELTDGKADFKMTALAEEYHESLALRERAG